MVDEQTFVREVRDMERMLYRVSRSLLPTQDECADAVQEALTKAWAKRDHAQLAFFRPWLMRIVINECHNIHRRKKRVVLMHEVEPGRSAAAAPDDALRQTIAALPDSLRLPLLLHYLEGFSVADVAHILRVPEGTVKSRLYQARKHLWAEMGVHDE